MMSGYQGQTAGKNEAPLPPSMNIEKGEKSWQKKNRL
jgi:hypothetical protein